MSVGLLPTSALGPAAPSPTHSQNASPRPSAQNPGTPTLKLQLPPPSLPQVLTWFVTPQTVNRKDGWILILLMAFGGLSLKGYMAVTKVDALMEFQGL